ncbi:hypothetical protein GF407_17585 [candidate division KSB1 bacterium]|nr:hypothetical protein [candidate division KSB1 bacterium]
MALSWVLRDQRVTSALIGVSSPEQLDANLRALGKSEFAQEHLDKINALFPMKTYSINCQSRD